VPPNSEPDKPGVASRDTAVLPANEGSSETTPTTGVQADAAPGKPARKASVQKPLAEASALSAADRSTKKAAPRKPAARKPAARKPAGSVAATAGAPATAAKAVPSANGGGASNEGANNVAASSGSSMSARAADSTAATAPAAQPAPTTRPPAKSAPAKASRPAAAKTTAARSTAAKATAAKTAAAKSATAAKTVAARSAAARTSAAQAAATAMEEAANAPGAVAVAGAGDAPADTAAVEKEAEQQVVAAPASAREPTVEPAVVQPVIDQPVIARPATTPAIDSTPATEALPRPAATAAALTTPVAATVAESPAPALSSEPITKTGQEPRSPRPSGTRYPRPSKQTAPTPDPTAPVVLSVSGLVKRFGQNVAVSGIDLEVRAGSFFGIVGPNGAGKTTTLSMVTGLLRPDAGSIVVHGIDVWAHPVEAKRIIGVLPDRLRLFDRLTGAQLLYYSGILRGLDADTVRIRSADLAAAFGLEDALNRLVADYSAGMTKKIALACALIHSPRILVLDEPFESVDPVSAVNVTEILQKYVASGGTVVLSSHGMDMIQRVCDHVAIIVEGAVLDSGTVEEVRGAKSLEERFVELAGGRKVAEGMEWLHSFSD
jgi:ABC-type multidrug transport system ATPase subunit